jgi:Family of unknown function (DUF6529)
MATVVEARRGRLALAGVLLAGCVVAVGLGVYGRGHGHSRPVFVVGFSGVIQFKVWLATAAVVLVLVQVTTALWMWGRLPGAGSAPGWVGHVHRWSGTIAFVLLIPVALNCLLTFGFESASTRVVLHSLAGCVFYGAYTAKMLGLRVRGLPGWGLPLLGGVVFTSLIVLWLTSALWFFGLNQPLT